MVNEQFIYGWFGVWKIEMEFNCRFQIIYYFSGFAGILLMIHRR